MREELEIGLRENLVDSLTEALAKYQQAAAGNTRANKFCILHFMHFSELYLKYYVSKDDINVIFEKNRGRNSGKQKTIGIHHAIKIMKKDANKYPPFLFDDLTWAKDLRNEIEHYKFKMDLVRWESTIGRLAKNIQQLNRDYGDIDFKQDLEKDKFELFNKIATKYDDKLHKSVDRVVVFLNNLDDKYKRKKSFYPTIYMCARCENITATKVPNKQKSSFICHFCSSTKIVKKSDKLIGSYFCIVEIPERYKTKTERVIDVPEHKKEVPVPSRSKWISVPATYKNISKKILVGERELVWRVSTSQHSESIF